jgi:hypothetical protein
VDQEPDEAQCVRPETEVGSDQDSGCDHLPLHAGAEEPDRIAPGEAEASNGPACKSSLWMLPSVPRRLQHRLGSERPLARERDPDIRFDARAVPGERGEGFCHFLERCRERFNPEEESMVDETGMEDDHRLTLPLGSAANV